MHCNQHEWKPIQASLLITLSSPDYSRTPHGNNQRSRMHQTQGTSIWESLFIISLFENHSSIPMKHTENNRYHNSNPLFGSLPKKAGFQSHTRNNRRRNNGQSSIPSIRSHHQLHIIKPTPQYLPLLFIKHIPYPNTQLCSVKLFCPITMLSN